MDTLAQGPVADRYRLEGLVGEGGMGAVYRAVDQRTARTVAVKIIREAGARDQRMIRLFNREIRAVARHSRDSPTTPAFGHRFRRNIVHDWL